MEQKILVLEKAKSIIASLNGSEQPYLKSKRTNFYDYYHEKVNEEDSENLNTKLHSYIVKLSDTLSHDLKIFMQ